MASNVEGTTAPPESEMDELVARVEANADELVELLDLLVATKQLGADLAPELKTATAESRESLEELRLALEREETLVLLQTVGENVETLTELLELLDATKDLADDLVPEVKTVAADARKPLEELRVAFEGQEPLVLLQKLGENTDTFIELLDLLEATEGLVTELIPELKAAAAGSRSSFEQLRIVVAGFADARGDRELEPYEMGQNLGNMLSLAERLGDPKLINSVDAGLTAFTDERTSEPTGIRGLLGALRDDDVRQGLGTLVEFLRRMGKAQKQE
ncbi:hypothetical protein C474_14189 [Halogeometricum pallidum JCM 14848]|uniref:DUF1641 domain-containing protein n=2 Tax=Halogeometricum TaxID=60846 RepID=M0D1U1_HALPD|nr:hypothetical protein C474_14189 [Halogeometricum pallidum JCM 14848]